MERIGIVAGWGSLPVIAAREARRQGFSPVVCAVVADLHPELRAAADGFARVELGELDKIIGTLHEHGAKAVLLAGKVKKEYLFSLRPDARLAAVLAGLTELSDEAVNQGVAAEFEREGLPVLSQAEFLRDYLVQAGLVAGRAPEKREARDIQFGLARAKSVAALGIGQTLVVKDRVVIAVEAVEGTDAAIRRGATLGGPGTTVVKVARPGQDVRFDVPTVGLETIQAMREGGCSCLAIEAGTTFIMEREDLVRAADAAGIAVVAVAADISPADASPAHAGERENI